MNELLNRYFSNTLTDAEKSTLIEQLENDEQLKEEFARLQNIVALSSAIIDREEDTLRADEKYKKMMLSIQKSRLRRVSLSVLKYASIVALIAVLSWFASQKHASMDDGYTYINALKGQQVYVVLADGTEVWLSSRTQLKVPNQFNKSSRKVELNGEGFFSVSQNSEMPFVVATKQYNVQATGTQFNVFSYFESPVFETDLVEGGVFVYDKDTDATNPLYLLPNEKVYCQSGELHKQASNYIKSSHIRNSIYVFDNQLLRDIAVRLELWYDVKITIMKPEIKDYVFSGKFRQTDEIGNILQAIKATGKFNYKIIKENEIEIY